MAPKIGVRPRPILLSTRPDSFLLTRAKSRTRATKMATSVELRFEWPAGRAVFFLTPEEALKAAVALRRLGLGLSYRQGKALVTTATSKFTEAERVLRREVRGRT